MNRSLNSTLVLDVEQKTADTIGYSKNKRGTEEVIDERNTLLLNTDEEVQNTTLNDWVAMLSGTPIKNSVDMTHKRQISGRKIKHHLPLSPQRNAEALPRSFLEIKRAIKRNHNNNRSPTEHPNLVTHFLNAGDSAQSMDIRKLQTRGKGQGPSVIKLPETLDIIYDPRPKRADSWDKFDDNLDSKTQQITEPKTNTPKSMSPTNTEFAMEFMKAVPNQDKPNTPNAASSKTPLHQIMEVKVFKTTELVKPPSKGEHYPANGGNSFQKGASKADHSIASREEKMTKAPAKRKAANEPQSKMINALVSPRDTSGRKEYSNTKKIAVAKTATDIDITSKRKSFPICSYTKSPQNRAASKRAPISTTHINLFSERPLEVNKTSKKSPEISSMMLEVDEAYSVLRNKINVVKNKKDRTKDTKRILTEIKTFISKMIKEFEP